MKRFTFLICGMMMFCSTASLAAAISRSTEDQLKQLELRTAKLIESTANDYAKEGFEAARQSLAAARVNAAAGKENETILKIELAEAQLNSAEAKAAEKELIEKVALHRVELKKLEAQLERYRQGEVN